MSQHWDQLYRQTKDLYGQEANQFIQQISAQIRIEGKTLAIAEGEGRNILYLAEQAQQQGYVFCAEVWDYSKVALHALAEQALNRSLELQVRHVDLSDVLWPSEQYQNVVCVFGHFDQATQQRVLQGVRQSLQHGGWFIGEVYSTEQLNYATGGPRQLEYLYDPSQFLQVFQQDHIQHFYLGEQERYEGQLHHGRCHVMQFAIQILKAPTLSVA